MSLNLDKSTWKRMAFGDVIENVTARIDDPSSAGVDRYVGLEHLDPGVLTIERWDSPDKVEAQKLRFHPGDVIFGRRRAYQKKVARADFEGICSAHALVLRAKPEVIDPDFLPVFLASNYFLNRAIAISVGSLSPTVNWRDLKVEEFELPPLDEQKRIADLLWAVERHRQSLETQANRAGVVMREYCSAIYLRCSSDFPSAPTAELGELRMGRQKAPRYRTGAFSTPYIRVGNVGHLELDLADVAEMDFEPDDLDKYRLEPGDILLTEGDIVSPLNVGRAVMFRGEIADCGFQNHLIRFRSKVSDPSFYLPLFEGMRLEGVFVRAARTTTVTSLGLTRLAKVEVPVLPTEVQQAISMQFGAIRRHRDAVQSESESLAKLRSTLLSTIFDGGQ